MKITLQNSIYTIVDYGIVLLSEENSNLIFNIDTENNFKFKLILKFISDQEGSKQVINRTISQNEIIMECVNFLSSGTGTSIPIEIATIHGKKLFIMFWTYIEGDFAGQKRVQSVKYTLFLER